MNSLSHEKFATKEPRSRSLRTNTKNWLCDPVVCQMPGMDTRLSEWILNWCFAELTFRWAKNNQIGVAGYKILSRSECKGRNRSDIKSKGRIVSNPAWDLRDDETAVRIRFYKKSNWIEERSPVWRWALWSERIWTKGSDCAHISDHACFKVAVICWSSEILLQQNQSTNCPTDTMSAIWYETTVRPTNGLNCPVGTRLEMSGGKERKKKYLS